MIAAARSFTLDGITARPVRVKADVHRGLPSFSVVGLPEIAVREMRERVRAALANSGFELPMRRIVINLGPSSLRKSGPGLDLAVAVVLLVASGQLDLPQLPQLAMVGELALDGSVRSVAGALASAEAARDQGSQTVLVPTENGPQAALAEGIDVVGLDRLTQLVPFGRGEWMPRRPRPLAVQVGGGESAPDMADLRGNHWLRHALEIAAAGGHSLLMVGPPGAGKSLAAVRLPSILPALSNEEALEVARIASTCGQLGGGLIARPFRAPHYSISRAGLVGGGSPRQPGEVTRAHRGVLFLDEFFEFGREALEALKVPLETGGVSLEGTGTWRRLPARFLLVAAASPCPCGRGKSDPQCICTPSKVQHYRDRLSRTLAERIDIHIEIQRPSAAEIGGPSRESSATVRERVQLARERQERRLGPGRCNEEMTPLEVRDCALEEDAALLLAYFRAERCVGERALDRAVRLARTIADLAETEEIGIKQMALALTLRQMVGPNRTNLVPE